MVLVVSVFRRLLLFSILLAGCDGRTVQEELAHLVVSSAPLGTILMTGENMVCRKLIVNFGDTSDSPLQERVEEVKEEYLKLITNNTAHRTKRFIPTAALASFPVVVEDVATVIYAAKKLYKILHFDDAFKLVRNTNRFWHQNHLKKPRNSAATHSLLVYSASCDYCLKREVHKKQVDSVLPSTGHHNRDGNYFALVENGNGYQWNVYSGLPWEMLYDSLLSYVFKKSAMGILDPNGTHLIELAKIPTSFCPA
ncbi:hypothetical protein L596_025536 [Steinernema carpocapsae]|uniref:Uncharacterized protein n=1 Tax=Steinernema carpocapsae TaxID=34508 RepID=A0A4U5M822_STECR|nr:hypothetical protein L596_025536 [Steinernema carpocapsae]